MERIDLTGKIFSRLFVEGFALKRGKHLYWNCTCSCGKKVLVSGSNLKSKIKPTKSCGCWNAEFIRANFKHGLTGTPEFITWRNMIRRCHNPRYNGYYKYGARGIKVCKAWRYSFLTFLKDMGKKPTSKHTIDRKNNYKGYNKQNCRWATYSEQNANRRPYGEKSKT